MSEPLVQLDPDQIHIWCARPQAATDAVLLAAYRALLTEDETARMQRFHFERDRLRFLVTRALVRSVLSRYAPGAPAHWRFENNAYGKPALVAPSGLEAAISFNISHTAEMVVMAVSQSCELGVDVEHVLRRAAPLDVAEHYFSDAEVAALQALPAAAQPARFFALWTLKEAYIKACGMGLSIPLDQFGFAFDSGAATLSVAPALGDDAGRWHFWQHQLSPEHLLAVCAEHGGRARRSVSLFDVVPLGAAQLVHTLDH